MSLEEIKIVERMDCYGGSFVKALAQCFYKADPINFHKLRITFPEYWEIYKNFGN